MARITNAITNALYVRSIEYCQISEFAVNLVAVSIHIFVVLLVYLSLHMSLSLYLSPLALPSLDHFRLKVASRK